MFSTFGAYHIVRQEPFTEKDIEEYAESAIEIWDKIYPGAKKVTETYQFTLPSHIRVTDMSKEQQELGYKPKYNFGTFIQEFATVE